MTVAMNPLRLPRMRIEVKSEPWMARGACRGEDPNVFVPDRTQPRATIKLAVAIAGQFCACCPVTDECLDHGARINDDSSVRAGLYGRQLQLAIKARRRRGV